MKKIEQSLLEVLSEMFIIFLSIVFLVPSHAFAESDFVSNIILQGSTIDLESQIDTIWQKVVPIALQSTNGLTLDDIAKLHVTIRPQGTLILPAFASNASSAIRQSSSTNALNYTYSSRTSTSLLQGTAPMILQGDGASNTVVKLVVNSPKANISLTIPSLSIDGTLLINNLSQIITNKAISGIDNILTNIPNSALTHSSIKLIGGNGISITDGDDVGLGDTVTITNSGISTINGLSVTNNGSNTLDIAADKTFTVANSITLGGTDNSVLTFQGTDTYIGRATSDTLTNKTIAAATNTISGLTNSNLSGAAGISNTNLANSSLTISSGSGLSGGGAVSLGDTLSLVNAGVLSLSGTTNQVTASGSTGNITLTLPQNINTSSSPSFAALNLTNSSNQLVLGTTNTGTLNWAPSSARILTLPDNTDTLIGKTTSDVLTNKTLTTPVINGAVTTTGLTLPAFTASGTLTGSGSPTITGFGSINGLTFSSVSDGITIAGGTTPRTLTLTGANITIGSIIKPTSSGALVIQSNGANILSLDAGGSAGILIGTTSATSITLGADATVSANKSFSITTADKLTVGGIIIPQTIPIAVPISVTSVTQVVFIADTTYQVTGTKCVPSVLSSSGTFQVTVESGTTAAGAGTAQLTGTISLSGVANTVVSGTLIASPTTLNAGDRISAKLGGLLTGLLGNCTIYIKRV